MTSNDVLCIFTFLSLFLFALFLVSPLAWKHDVGCRTRQRGRPLRAAEAAITAIPTKAVDGLAGLLENSVSKQWNGSAKDAKRIHDTATARAVLGSPLGIKRKHYARSPILKYMKSNIHTNGTIYVAYVPPGLGKTTACHAYLHKGYRRRGIAFVPTDQSLPYFHSMLRLFDLDPTKPPDGFLQHLITSLSEPDPGILIFMTRGIYMDDVNLLNNIKKGIRETRVSVVVLTANEESANFLLSQNDLKFVCPLVTAPALREISVKYGPIKRDVAVPLRWGEYLSMKWDKKELQLAMQSTTDYQCLDAQRQAKIDSRFSQEFDELADEQRERTGPSDMLCILLGGEPVVQSDTMSPTNASTVAAENVAGRGCGCGDHCIIM